MYRRREERPAAPATRELAGQLGVSRGLVVRAARTDPGTVVVTTGAAQAFSLLAQVLRERGGDRIGFEGPGQPSHPGAPAGQPPPVPIPVDRSGVDVSGLDQNGVQAVLVTPAHQYPAGVVLSPARRAELVAWARAAAHRLVIEDDDDAEYREPVGCLQGVAPDVVALVGSALLAAAGGTGGSG